MGEPTPVRLGLDRLADEGCARLRGLRVGLLCHAASVASDLRHITRIFKDSGIIPVRCFGPEHGIWADVQDMIPSADTREPVTGAPVVSLYGTEEASLVPKRTDLVDLDVLVVDLQDVGSRYYTYCWTAALVARAAAEAGVRCLILDRPNPLGGLRVEGGAVEAAFTSFVGRYSVPTRHGLTIGELVRLVGAREGFTVEVLPMTGWRRAQYHDETGLPWVQPSPNMPTLDTALVYPGLCLIEGTNLSEGRGTTRPFEIIGADFIDPFRFAAALEERGLAGVRFRPLYYRPTFHKFGGQTIGGVALHVTDRATFEPLRTGLHLLAVCRSLFGTALRWRTEVYEFVGDRLAIDLLFGGPAARALIDAQGDVDALWQAWQAEASSFRARREGVLVPGVPMKLAFVAHSHGNVALLERVLLALVDRYQVSRVVALESAVGDVEAVIRSRSLRYPMELAPQHPGYADYVLASVLAGVADAPTEEVARTTRLRSVLAPGRGAGQVFELAGRRIGVGVVADPTGLAVLVPTGVERRLLVRDEAPVRVAPGHLRAVQHDGEPASALVISAVDGTLQAQFVGADGSRMGRAEVLEVGRS